MKSKNVKLTNELSASELRQQLLDWGEKDAQITVHVDEEIRFTQIRTLLAIINIYAFAQHCQLRYNDEREFINPPLKARYSHAPHITTAKTK